MAKKKVFVSLDWDNDKRYKFLLDAWDANPNFDFLFSVLMPSEVTSDNISRIKAALTARIKSATYTLVIVGKEANTQHKDHVLIGFKNWINYEVNKSAANRNEASRKVTRTTACKRWGSTTGRSADPAGEIY